MDAFEGPEFRCSCLTDIALFHVSVGDDLTFGLPDGRSAKAPAGTGHQKRDNGWQQEPMNFTATSQKLCEPVDFETIGQDYFPWIRQRSKTPNYVEVVVRSESRLIDWPYFLRSIPCIHKAIL